MVWMVSECIAIYLSRHDFLDDLLCYISEGDPAFHAGLLHTAVSIFFVDMVVSPSASIRRASGADATVIAVRQGRDIIDIKRHRGR